MVKPTDKASMEVAIPCTKSATAPTFFSGARSQDAYPLPSLHSVIPSESILPPMKERSARAIQGMSFSNSVK